MASSAAEIGSVSTARGPSGETDRSIVSLALLAVLGAVWPVFVFTGHQAAYVGTAVVAGLVGVELVRIRSRLILGYLVLVVGLIGTEVNGELGRGASPMGSLRLLDIVMASSIVGLLVTAWRRGEIRRPQSIRISASALRRFVSRYPGWTISVVLIMYAGVLWAINGSPVNGLLRTDIRMLLLALGTWALVRACRIGPWTTVAYSLTAVGALCSLKAFAIYASEIWVIGPYDRLQASVIDGPQVRVILLGGDTIMILAPAVAVLTASLTDGRRRQALLLAAGSLACAGLLISGTRTSLLVAGGLACGVVAARVVGGTPGRVRGLAVLTVVGMLGMTAALAVTGVGERFLTPDPEHVGLNFRRDELETIRGLPAPDLVLGQGFAGGFIGKDVNGRPTEAGWSHVLPAWVVLKLGVVGLVAVVVLLSRLGWLASFALRQGRAPLEAAVGLTLAIGILTLSLTLNRAALPEGAVLSSLAAGLIVTNHRRLSVA